MIGDFSQARPVMWPLLVASLVTVTVVFERFFFVVRGSVMEVTWAVVSHIFPEGGRGAIGAGVRYGKYAGGISWRAC